MAKHITEEQVDLLVERLINRVEKINNTLLENIGLSIKNIRELMPSKAHELVQILKYGGKYDDIINKISKYSELNLQDIDEIFTQYAKKDQSFYEQFYEYRNKPFIPYEQNTLLQQQTRALTNVVKNEMYNFTRNNVLGYTINGKFFNLRDTYNSILDEALLNVGQGKETFDGAMKSIMEQIGGSGLKTLEYESGRSIRLDSAVRMHLKGRLRELHNENQKLYGEEFGADGIEISVHANPAEDHELVQGRQFTLKEYEKLNNGFDAKDYKGNTYTLDTDHKNGYRPISEMNCYHYIFSIILGISKPEYSDEQLEQIIKDNDKGFEYEGQHYSNYEGTQLQRKLELEIRKQKDTQILAKASDNKILLDESQKKISILTKKYKELSDISGLPMKLDRLKVNGYKSVKISVPKRIDNIKGDRMVASNRLNVDISMQKRTFDEWKEVFDEKNVKIKDSFNNMDEELFNRNINHLDYLTNKYDVTKNQYLEIGTQYDRRYMGVTYYAHNEIYLSRKYFDDKKSLIDAEERSQKLKWHNPIRKENLDLYTLTHEYGHAIEDDYIRRYLKRVKNYDTEIRRVTYSIKEDNLKKEIDKDIRDSVFDKIRKKEKLNISQIKDKYFSGYAKSKRNYEWFAETFAQLELGESNAMTEALREWMEENLWM